MCRQGSESHPPASAVTGKRKTKLRLERNLKYMHWLMLRIPFSAQALNLEISVNRPSEKSELENLCHSDIKRNGDICFVWIIGDLLK